MNTAHRQRMLLCAVLTAASPVSTGLFAAQTVPRDQHEALASVQVKTIEDDSLDGELLGCSMADGIVVRQSDGKDRRVPLPDVVHILTDRSVAPRSRGETTVALIDGDRIFGRISGARDDSVILETADLDDVAVPLEWIKSITYGTDGPTTNREVLELFERVGRSREGAAAEPGEDIILLSNGDVMRGFITGIDADGVSIESKIGATTVPHRLILALRLATTPPAPPPAPYVRLTLKNSGRLTVSELNWSDEVARIRLRDGREFTFEAARIVRADVEGGKWEWLSGQRPISFEHTPMVSLAWDYRNDRNVLGGPIVVAGDTFERGIGVHSRSSLTFDLKGSYRDFVTYFGIDDDSGPLADVSVQVLVDGRRRFEQENIRRGTLHGPIRVDVKRAKRIELIVDFGQNGELQDRFNWVEPALVR